MVRALDVARYFVHRSDLDAGDPITHLKVQKLVYYAQAWHLALFGPPLFQDRIEAWMHGPVVPEVFEAFKGYKYNPILPTDVPAPELPSNVEQHLNEVWKTYGPYTAKYLEDLTHQEEPWIHARGDCQPGDSCNNVIELDAMRTYYGAKLVSA